MFGRVTFYNTFQNSRTAMQKQEMKEETVRNQLATQNKLQRLSDDPIAAAHATRYASVLAQRNVFIKNNRQIYDSLQVTEGYARNAIDLLQESRALAVRAANGTFAKSDRQAMAQTIDQHLEALYALANAQNGDGRYIFGGTRTKLPPFRQLRTASLRMHKNVINTVEYVGSNNTGQVRISDVDSVQRTVAGSDMFWARRTQVRSGVNALGYSAQTDGAIVINNVNIPITQGDSVYAIVDKINRSTSDVQAFVDTASGGLAIETNASEQLWINDGVGQTLQDLGLVNGQSPPHNIAGSSTAFQESVFDSLIRLRDAMFQDDYQDIGGKALASIDGSLESVLQNVSKIGAVTERLDVVYKRMYQKDVPNFTRQLDNNVSIDFTEAVQRMAEFSSAKQAAYTIGARIMNTTLLQYLQ